MQLGLNQNSSAHCYSSSVYTRTWFFLNVNMSLLLLLLLSSSSCASSLYHHHYPALFGGCKPPLYFPFPSSFSFPSFSFSFPSPFLLSPPLTLLFCCGLGSGTPRGRQKYFDAVQFQIVAFDEASAAGLLVTLAAV